MGTGVCNSVEISWPIEDGHHRDRKGLCSNHVSGARRHNARRHRGVLRDRRHGPQNDLRVRFLLGLPLLHRPEALEDRRPDGAACLFVSKAKPIVGVYETARPPMMVAVADRLRECAASGRTRGARLLRAEAFYR